VSAPTAETIAEALRPLTAEPARAGVFLDIDGTLAPIVRRAEDAHVPKRTSQLLGQIARRYGCVACVSGRSASEARRLVGVGRIIYAGSHGAELIEPGGSGATILPAFASWTGRVRAFAHERDERDLRLLRVRIEDKGPIAAFHWRGVPDEDAARTRLEGVAQEAETEGCASFAGDDATDLDAFDALERLELDAVVKIGVASDEGPVAIAERADLVVDGTDGMVAVLEALAEALGD
jgi:trehalose 6-phosphate phosphatase